MDLEQLGLTRGIVDAQQGLTRMEHDLFSALRPVDIASLSTQNFLRDAYASSFAGVGLRAAEVAAGLQFNGIAKVAADLSDSWRFQESGLRAAVASLTLPVSGISGLTAALGPLKSDNQWKAALMRWSGPPVSGIVGAQYADLVRAISGAVRPQLVSASFIADLQASSARAYSLPPIGLPRFDTPTIDLSSWPSIELGETPEPEPAPQHGNTDAASSGTGAITADSEPLRRKVEALEREVARMRRPFIVRWGERIVVALLTRVIWEHTPVGEYSAVVIEKLEVVIDGVTYILPYVP